MGSVKELILSIEEDDVSEDELEIYADSVRHALEIASEELNVDISMLDYEIIKKGTKGIFGVGRQPYIVVVSPVKVDTEYEDLDKIEKKLAKFSDSDLVIKKIDKDADSTFKIRVTKSGIWLTIVPAKGKGKKIEVSKINNKLLALRINNADIKVIDKEVSKPSGEPVKLGDWISNPEYDGSMQIEMSEDEMSVYAHFNPPRFSGRHMEVDDVMDAAKNSGVVIGIKEERIKEYLEEMDYARPLLAAEGDKPKKGKDAFIDYKVEVDRSKVSFEEDEKGQVDFKDLQLLENVVVGQLLAIKVPAEEGIPGRTVTNRLIPTKSGKDVQIRYGKNTILSEDGLELTAATNGQVEFKGGKIYIEEVLYIKGDVSLQTGNITSCI